MPLLSLVGNLCILLYIVVPRYLLVSTCILPLVRIYSQEVCYQYWPSSGDQQYGEYSVDLLGEEELEGHIIRTLNITHSTV